jgi:hypothetical protein
MTAEARSIGEQRVRRDFNPSGNDAVGQIKRKTAELIDLCYQSQPATPDGAVKMFSEETRLWVLAMKAYEEAAMWAVKAATIDK